jgi:hypothetical protein
MWQQIITTITAVVTVMLGIFGYERMKNKDSASITTTLAILMTKVDSLLSMSNDLKRLEEKVIRHDEEIKNLKDTHRFAKITEEIINGGLKND